MSRDGSARRCFVVPEPCIMRQRTVDPVVRVWRASLPRRIPSPAEGVDRWCPAVVAPRLGLPLRLPRRLCHREPHRYIFADTAVVRAADRGGAKAIKADGYTDMLFRGADAVGRIEPDPAKAGNVNFRPRVAHLAAGLTGRPNRSLGLHVSLPLTAGTNPRLARR
jgi:hypothetical protein